MPLNTPSLAHLLLLLLAISHRRTHVHALGRAHHRHATPCRPCLCVWCAWSVSFTCAPTMSFPIRTTYQITEDYTGYTFTTHVAASTVQPPWVHTCPQQTRCQQTSRPYQYSSDRASNLDPSSAGRSWRVVMCHRQSPAHWYCDCRVSVNFFGCCAQPKQLLHRSS